jgi:flagellar motor switch protein FliN
MAHAAWAGDSLSEKLDAIEPVRGLLDQFAESLAQVLEAMAEQRPEAKWQAASGTVADVVADPQDQMLWWEQPLQFAQEMRIWVGAPRTAWEQAGTVTLKAAGLDTVEIDEARNTWLEILGQALSPVARAIGSMLGREVTCEAGAERTPEAGIEEWARVSLAFPDAPLAPLLVAFSPKLLEVLVAPPRAEEPQGELATVAPTVNPADAEPAISPARSRTMNLLLDVDLPVSISFGRTQLPMKDVIKQTTGSIVELNRSVNEPVEVLVNQCLIARGEVVVVEGNYGVRILEIASRQERIRSLR